MRLATGSAGFALALALAALLPARPGNAAVRPAPAFELDGARFLARGRDLDLAVTAEGAAIATRGRGCREVVQLTVEGHAGSGTLDGLELLPGQSHYLRGNDPACWTTDVPRFARVRSRGLLPGVDLIWHSTPDGAFEHDFVLAPDARPEALAVRFEGARSLRVDDRGDLTITTPGGAELRAPAPVAWQEDAHGLQPVAARWELRGDLVAGFALGPHDARRPLIIDPALEYSSYIGGRYDDEPQRVAVDAAGNIYLAGYTDSPDFPVASPIAPYQDLTDVFVTKLDATTGAPVWSTFLGGAGDEAAFGLAVDPSGGVVVVGETDSADFPQVGALQPVYGGGGDAFVARLDANGATLVHSSYLGGSDDETAFAAAFDGTGGMLVAGRTASLDFPVRRAFQSTLAGGFYDAFLVRLDPGGATLDYATYLGGSDDDEAFDVALDSAGRPHLTGDTFSTDFPLVNARQPTLVPPLADAFVSRFAASGAAIELSTYLGGADDEWGTGIAVDALGNILVGGTTFSDDFPARGPLHGPPSGERGFLSKLLADGSDFVYSTWFGGSGSETAIGFAADGSGAAYLAGLTSSTDLPMVFGVQPLPGGGVTDGFVARLDPSGAVLTCSTYLGGRRQDSAISVAAIDPTHFVVVGWSDSTDLVVTPGAQQPAYAGGVADGFVTRIGCTTAPGDVGNTLWLTKDPTLSDEILTWTDAAQAASYRLYAETDKAAPFVTIAALGANGVIGITRPLAPAPATLYYRIAAGNCCGEGPR